MDFQIASPNFRIFMYIGLKLRIFMGFHQHQTIRLGQKSLNSWITWSAGVVNLGKNRKKWYSWSQAGSIGITALDRSCLAATGDLLGIFETQVSQEAILKWCIAPHSSLFPIKDHILLMEGSIKRAPQFWDWLANTRQEHQIFFGWTPHFHQESHLKHEKYWCSAHPFSIFQHLAVHRPRPPDVLSQLRTGQCIFARSSLSVQLFYWSGCGITLHRSLQLGTSFNGNFRIRINGGTLVPYVWPYFAGIFPKI